MPVADRPAEGRFDGGVHHFPLRVYFEDTDLSGVVYHANYLRYMERARSDMLRIAGIDQRAFFEGGGGAYAVADVQLRFRSPARLDDALMVVSRLERVRAADVLVHQQVRCGTALLAEARITVALVSASGRPTRQPPHWIAIYQGLVGQGELQRP
ncbi:YbgC/FadM family acyl-CoA thioesterase [Sphingomonas gellani]|uniref:YbgC/FadM family acyl-CoA thioesterase n=1 Tax=Sphingomonas gellani TaxID=1166340 RepID=UPI000B8A5B9D|nr:YbgC/FadM family acyl-CoA thioesterase [Sphingomonas gellani]